MVSTRKLVQGQDIGGNQISNDRAVQSTTYRSGRTGAAFNRELFVLSRVFTAGCHEATDANSCQGDERPVSINPLECHYKHIAPPEHRLQELLLTLVQSHP